MAVAPRPVAFGADPINWGIRCSTRCTYVAVRVMVMRHRHTEVRVPTAEQPPATPASRDYTALKYLGAVCVAEIGLLYLLLAVETPLSPFVRRLGRNPIGVFTLVMIVVTLLFYGMAAVLGLRERIASRKRNERVV